MFRLLFLCTLFFSYLCSSEALYLTYPGDPAHSMAIHWIEEQGESSCKVYYKEEGTDTWLSCIPYGSPFGKYRLKRALLNNLKADTGYEFQLEGEDVIYRFRTLPEVLNRPMRIAIGGDAYQIDELHRKMSRLVASYNPDFVIIGGDIAYANLGDPAYRWKNFCKYWRRRMHTQEGYLIPLMVSIGNHDISEKGFYFLELFPYFEKASYGRLTVCQTISFFLLDTGHLAPVDGKQAQWLKQALKQDTSSYKFAVYHVSAYPSVYPYEGVISQRVRAFWCPLFERYDVLVGFENHNHSYKRTYPLRGDKIDANGVVYIGDGSWGVMPRPVYEAWYLKTSVRVNAFSLLTVSKEGGAQVEVFDIEGQLFDEWKR